jgi:hypothetical protein
LPQGANFRAHAGRKKETTYFFPKAAFFVRVIFLVSVGDLRRLAARERRFVRHFLKERRQKFEISQKGFFGLVTH